MIEGGDRGRAYISQGNKYFEVTEEGDSDFVGNVIAAVLVAAVTSLVAFCACAYVAEYKEEKDEITEVKVLNADPEIIYS